MNDYGIRFYPIPRNNPIPQNVACLIGGISGLNPTFVLSLNGREIVVQAPTDPPGFGRLEDLDQDHPFFQWMENERTLKIYGHYLEIVVSSFNLTIRSIQIMFFSTANFTIRN